MAEERRVMWPRRVARGALVLGGALLLVGSGLCTAAFAEPVEEEIAFAVLGMGAFALAIPPLLLGLMAARDAGALGAAGATLAALALIGAAWVALSGQEYRALRVVLALGGAAGFAVAALGWRVRP